MIDQTRKRLLIILNPAAGRRSCRKFNHVVEILKKNNLSLEVRETKYPGHAKLIAEKKVNEFDMIVAAGGDGTINEVLNGIYPHRVPIGIIPLGTANVLAKEIGLEEHAQAIADCLLRGYNTPCWMGKVNGKYFSLMASAGLDAISVANVNTKLKKIIGKAAYILSFLREVIRSKNHSYQVIADGNSFEASNVIVTKGRLYGGQYICAPDARLEENKLYVLIAQKKGRLNALKYACLMLWQKYPYDESIIIRPANVVIIKCNDKNIPFQIDGDFAGFLSSEITLSEYSINLVQPENRFIND